MINRNLSTLIAGIVLVGLGCLFLAVNVYQIDIDWWIGIKLIFPALFIWGGSLKLWRHFTWSLEELQEKPGKAGLLSGIFWLSLGVITALAVFDKLDFLPTVGLYWPVVLLIFGLGKILDFFRMKEISRSNFGEITGVIFVILLGLCCMKLHQLNVLVLEQDPFWERIPEFIGIEELVDPTVEYSFSQDLDLAGVSGIEVKNAYGDVHVEGLVAANRSGSAKLLSSIREKDEARADEIFDQVKLEVTKENGIIVLSTNRKDLKSRGKRLTTSIWLQIPEDMKLDVNNEFGEVSVTGMKNSCVLTAAKGEVNAFAIEGPLQIKTDAESVELRQITGDINIEAKFAEVDIDEVTGDVSVITSHKPVRVVSVEGNLKVENRHDDVDAEKVTGTVDINNPGGEVSLSGIGGEVTVINSKGDVRVSGTSGAVNLTTAYGDVSLEDIKAALDITARYADIEGNGFHSGVTIKGQNAGVELEDLAGTLLIETSHKPVYVSDSRGPINIQNDLGEVVLRLADKPAEDVRIESRQGDIHVELPGQAAFNIRARVTNGSISSDFGSPSGKDALGDSVFETSVGENGPQLNFSTSGSVIEIRRIQ